MNHFIHATQSGYIAQLFKLLFLFMNYIKSQHNKKQQTIYRLTPLNLKELTIVNIYGM